MSGNVWEWVWDYYHPKYPRGKVQDPLGPRPQPKKSVRGGGWSSIKSDLRVSMRNAAKPDAKLKVIGFRLVRTAPTNTAN